MPSMATRPALDDLADYFARHVDKQMPVSPETARSYTGNVRRFAEWLATQEFHDYEDVVTDPATATKAVIKYKHHLQVTCRRKPKTVDAALTAIAAMYSWLDMDRPNVPLTAGRNTDDPPALTEEEARTVLAAAQARGHRDHAIVMMLYAAGPRVSECAALDVEDMRLADRIGEVAIRWGKGGKYREVDLNGQAVKVMKVWLRHRADKHGLTRDSGPLFVSKYGKRLDQRSIRNVVAAVGDDADVDLWPHRLRHTAINRLARQNVDLTTIQAFSGHSNADSLSPYVRSRKADRKAAVELLTIDY